MYFIVEVRPVRVPVSPRNPREERERENKRKFEKKTSFFLLKKKREHARRASTDTFVERLHLN